MNKIHSKVNRDILILVERRTIACLKTVTEYRKSHSKIRKVSPDANLQCAPETFSSFFRISSRIRPSLFCTRFFFVFFS